MLPQYFGPKNFVRKIWVKEFKLGKVVILSVNLFTESHLKYLSVLAHCQSPPVWSQRKGIHHKVPTPLTRATLSPLTLHTEHRTHRTPLTGATLSPLTLCTEHDNCYNSDPDNHDCGDHHRDQNRCDHHHDHGKHLHLHHVTAAETVHNSGRNWPKILYRNIIQMILTNNM